MPFTTKTSIRVAVIAGVTALAVAAVVLTKHPPELVRKHLPQPTVATVPELEPVLQKQAMVSPISDSQLEDEGSRPIQTVVEAEQGDTLLDLLMKAGVERGEATKAIDALTEVYNPRALKTGQEVTVTFERPSDGIGSGPFDAVTLQPDAGRQVGAKRGQDGFSATEIKRQTIRQLAHFSGTIKGSLFESAIAAGVPPQVLAEMIRAYSYDVDFQRDIHPGDRFEVMFEHFVDSKGKLVRNGDILYASLTLTGEVMPIYRYVDSTGMADYYNAKGESVRKALLRTPVDGARISSGFGMRMHPILGFTTMHKGVDFAVSTGTPVMAAGAGTIDYAGPNGSYGYYVRIQHDAIHSTAYAHLSRFAQGIRVGKRVSQGQVIAFSGATGRATGPHLHYEVLVKDVQVNPMSVKFQSGNKLAGKELARFLSSIKEAQEWLVQTPVASKVALAKPTAKAN